MKRFTAVFWALIAVMAAASCAFGDATEQLLKAAQSENVNARTVERLIESGADVNASDEYGMTAMMLINLSDSKNSLEVIAMLIKYGADVNALIKYGADVNAKNKYGRTALMFVHKNESVKVLLKAKANTHAKANDGEKTLMAASRGQKPDPRIIKTLVEAGVPVNAKDNNDATALMYAAETNDHPDVIKALIKAGAIS